MCTPTIHPRRKITCGPSQKLKPRRQLRAGQSSRGCTRLEVLLHLHKRPARTSDGTVRGPRTRIRTQFRRAAVERAPRKAQCRHTPNTENGGMCGLNRAAGCRAPGRCHPAGLRNQPESEKTKTWVLVAANPADIAQQAQHLLEVQHDPAVAEDVCGDSNSDHMNSPIDLHIVIHNYPLSSVSL